MTFKNYFLKQIALYCMVVLTLFFLIKFDRDIYFTPSSFTTLLVFISFVFIMLILVEYFHDKKRHKQRQEMLHVIKQNQIPAQKFDDELIRILLANNQALQQDLLEMNAHQIKWIHDIKMPLATLELFIKNNHDLLNHTQKQFLELVSLDFDYLIHNKLMSDKVLTQVDDLFIEQFDIQPIITAIIKKNAPLFQTKKIALHFDIPVNTIIRSDVKSVQYVFAQLLHNAIKYTNIQGTISINMAYIDTKLHVYIGDNGVGIDTQDLPRIFDYGYTGTNGKNQKHNAASGIGLFMVKQILDTLEHEILVSSNTTDGTIVTLIF